MFQPHRDQKTVRESAVLFQRGREIEREKEIAKEAQETVIPVQEPGHLQIDEEVSMNGIQVQLTLIAMFLELHAARVTV